MPRSLPHLLQDILERSRRIQRYVEGHTRNTFLENQMLQDSVERNLQVIGEAIAQAVKLTPSLVWRVSNTRRIVAMRHLLSHHYYRVSPESIWGTLRLDLVRLEREIAEIQSTHAHVELQDE